MTLEKCRLLYELLLSAVHTVITRGFLTIQEISSPDFLRTRISEALDSTATMRTVLRKNWDLEATTCSWIIVTSQTETEPPMIMRMVKFKYYQAFFLSNFIIQIIRCPRITSSLASSLSTIGRILISMTFSDPILGQQSPSDSEIFSLGFVFVFCVLF